MTRNLVWTIAITTIAAPILHLISDVLEWSGSGFSHAQLLLNYAGFIPIPFLMIGLYAVQRPKIGWLGLVGALLYGIAFVYFAHTTLLSIEESLPNYEMLWRRLGSAYTFHGVLMVVGGFAFGFSSLKAGVLSRKGTVLFLFGLLVNFFLAFSALPDIFQTIGSAIRNVGLITIGIGLIAAPLPDDIES